MWQPVGYFDESDDNTRVYAIAGFVGHQKDCLHLHWEWEDRLLKKYDIEYFKAHELERGIGQFAKYRDDPSHPHQKFSKREKEFFTEIKTESIDIILEFSQIHGIGAVLLLPDYEQLKREYDEIGKLLPSPYFLCAQLVMMEAGFIMNAINATLEPYRQGVMLPVFDEQDEYSGRAKEMFESFAQKNPQCSGHLSPPDYENDKQYLMLQAADNLAYEVRRLCVRQKYETHILKRRAWERLKERVERVYKLNYEALKVIMDSQTPDTIPITPEIDNR